MFLKKENISTRICCSLRILFCKHGTTVNPGTKPIWKMVWPWGCLVWLLAWSHFNWTHQECRRLGMVVMREGLLSGPYIWLECAASSLPSEAVSERESWRKGASRWGRKGQKERKKDGWMNQRAWLPFEPGKCMFSLKLRRKKINPGILILILLVTSFLLWMSFNHGRVILIGEGSVLLCYLDLLVHMMSAKEGGKRATHRVKDLSQASSSIHRRAFL